MYLFGSTLGRTNYPCFHDRDGYHNLPRPYTDYKPNSPARLAVDAIWFTRFVAIEERVIYFLRQMYTYNQKAKMTLFQITLAKPVIPIECRITDSFFNHMALLGNLTDVTDGSIQPHKDEEDIITALLNPTKVVKHYTTRERTKK